MPLQMRMTFSVEHKKDILTFSYTIAVDSELFLNLKRMQKHLSPLTATQKLI